MPNQRTVSPQAGQKNVSSQQAYVSKELSYWKTQYQKEPYYIAGTSFVDYEVAYRAGVEWRSKFGDKRFEDVEQTLRNFWEGSRGEATIDWKYAKQAARAAWNRIEQTDYADTSVET